LLPNIFSTSLRFVSFSCFDLDSKFLAIPNVAPKAYFAMPVAAPMYVLLNGFAFIVSTTVYA
jgi:hypothetical protein